MAFPKAPSVARSMGVWRMLSTQHYKSLWVPDHAPTCLKPSLNMCKSYLYPTILWKLLVKVRKAAALKNSWFSWWWIQNEVTWYSHHSRIVFPFPPYSHHIPITFPSLSYYDMTMTSFVEIWMNSMKQPEEFDHGRWGQNPTHLEIINGEGFHKWGIAKIVGLCWFIINIHKHSYLNEWFRGTAPIFGRTMALPCADCLYMFLLDSKSSEIRIERNQSHRPRVVSR